MMRGQKPYHPVLSARAQQTAQTIKREIQIIKMNTAGIDTTNMCSHLRNKLMDADGVYHQIWHTINDDAELTAVVRSRQFHAYPCPHTTKKAISQ